MKSETVFETGETAVKPLGGFAERQASQGFKGCVTDITILFNIRHLFYFNRGPL
jgi:hypothetical protein